MGGFDARCRSIVFRLGVGVLAGSALALASGETNAPSAPSGLVAAYAFDEEAGQYVADASGNGNKGTIAGAWWTNAGHQEGGLVFDGIDDLVTVADVASLDLTTGMTLEAWVKPDTLGSSTTAAVLKERPGGLVYALEARSGALGPGAAIHNGVTETRARVVPQIPTDLWSHLAATHDGAALRVYVNGVELTSALAPGEIAASSSPLRLGGSNVAREWFSGTLDDVRIYNRALSATEIAADMVTPVVGPARDTSAPSTPSGLRVIRRTQSSIDLVWNPSSDDRGVERYGIYVDDKYVGASSTTSTTVGRLSCGTAYTLTVDAADAAGNRSAKATLTSSTSACPDTTPPSTPAGFAQTSSTQTTVTVTWTPASDNVGVTEHGLYRDGNRVATLGGSAGSHTFGGLSCGSSYLLGVDAADAAGNRSARASASGTTAACPSGGGTASVFLSPIGSDANPCTLAAPCKTLDRGYRVADPGEIVELAGGTYAGEQSIPAVTKSGSSRIVFRPAPGASVTLGAGIGVWGDHVELRGLTITDDFYVKCGADDVIFRDSKASLFFIRSATNISIVDVEFGPSHDISQIGHTEDCQFSPDNILMDRVYMHDFWWDGTAQSTNHMECLTISAANNFTLRNSKFHRCEDFDILVKHRYPVLKSTNMTFENNWFDKPWPDGTYAISFSQPDSGGTYENVLIRNNSFATPLLLRPEITWRNLQVIGNVGVRTGGSCSDYISRYNVWSAMDPCSATDRRAPAGFVNEAGFDLHLRADSIAVGHGDPSSYPSIDIDGQSRPQGGAPDAGADER